MRKTLSALLGVLLVLPAFAQEQDKGLRILWVDVEGGAATLVITPEGESLLMDCGWPGKRDAGRIARAAKEAGVEKIDHFIVSHYHVDHWGGAAALAELMPIGRFYYHAFPDASAKDVDPKLKEAYLKVSAGKAAEISVDEAVPIRGVQVRIVSANGQVSGEKSGATQIRKCEANPGHPEKPADGSDNARSIGYLLDFRGFKFLNLGDLTWNVEHKLVCPANLIGAVDVYQVTHHGLDQSNNPALLKAVQPTVAVVNNGAKKGGAAATFKWLKETPGLKDIFQVHRNVSTGAADNAPPELVANDAEACEGHGIVLTVDPSGKSYTVEVPSKKTKRTYPVK